MVKILLHKLFLTGSFLFFLINPLEANPGFFMENWIPVKAPSLDTYEEVSSPITAPQFTVQLHAADTVAKILPSLFGNNINPWLGKKLMTDEDYGIKHLKDLQISFLRLPGGNWSNKFLWDGIVHWNLLYGYRDRLSGRPNQSWTLTADDMTNMAVKIGAEPQICVNLSLARYIPGPDSIEQAAHYAAEWVRHVNGELGLNVRYWEVGNENYGDWQEGHIGNNRLDGTYYGKAFCIFADSMKAADPTIKIGAVVVERDNGNASGGYRWWMRDMLPLIQDKADYLVYHEYFTWKSNINDVTVEEMIDALPLIENAKTAIEDMVEKYTDKPRGHFPITITEYNVRAGMKDNQAISAIFNAMALAEFARNEYGLINLWNIANGYDDVEGDQGILTVDNPHIRDYTPHPTFYTYYLYRQMCGDVLLKTTTSDQSLLYTAATSFSGGEKSLLLVNPSDENFTIEVELEDFNPDGFAYGYTLQASSPTTMLMSLNKRTGTDVGPLDYDHVPVWRQTFEGKPVLNILPWSVQFVLFTEKKETTGVLNPSEYFTVHPNPVTDKLYMNDKSDIKVFNSNGELLLQFHGDEVDFSTFPSGIYYVIQNNKNTVRVIKQ
jgi:hypothetical protein